MVWEGVPWFVQGGQHSAEVARLLAYAAIKGGEGVVGTTDCKVTASPIPDGNVRIATGAVAVLNQSPGGSEQGYLLRNVGVEIKALTPQGSGGSRWDLVCVVVKDPQYPGQPDPPSVPNGPYLETVVYEDVPANTHSLNQVDADQTGYALARVKFDASDGTIVQADITDLRELLFSRQETHKFTKNGAAVLALDGTFTIAPPGSSWSVLVPTWARKAIIEARWSGIRCLDSGAGDGFAVGKSRVEIGGIMSSETLFRADAQNVSKPITVSTLAAEEVDVSSLAGDTVDLDALLAKTGGTGMTVSTVGETTVVAEITFKEVLA